MAVVVLGNVTPGVSPDVLKASVQITSAQVLALNSAVIEVAPAPRTNWCIIPIGVYVQKPQGTAYAGIASGEDLEFRYNNATGHELLDVETTGFLDQGSEQRRWALADQSNFLPLHGTRVVVHLGGAITTGNSPLNIDFLYRILPIPSVG